MLRASAEAIRPAGSSPQNSREKQLRLGSLPWRSFYPAVFPVDAGQPAGRAEIDLRFFGWSGKLSFQEAHFVESQS